MFISRKFLASLFFLQSAFISFGQITQAPAKDTLREFEVIRGPSMRAIKIDSVTTLQTVAGGAVIKQGNTLFKSDSLVINPTTHIVEAFGNIDINQGDTVHTSGQYLKYLGVEKMAYLKRNVKLTDKKGTLFTQDLDYNLESGIGNFYNGGKVIEGKNVITSTDGTYYADTKDVYFKRNVKVDGPKNHIRADSLLYNMQTKISSFISATHIKNDDVEINTSQGTYDLKTGNAFFTSRTTVKDSSNRIYTADNMALEDKSGNAQLEGNAVIIDSVNNFIITGNQIFLNKKNNSFLATRKPVLIVKEKNDSTYIAADTIFSGITTFVENGKNILEKDSVINVNFQQNEKVQEVEIADSSHKNLHIPSKEIIDSVKSDAIKTDSLPPPLKDSLPPENIKDITQKDGLVVQNKNDSAAIDSVMNDTIPKIRDSSFFLNKKDSATIDSSKNITTPKVSDSSFSLNKNIKDSANKSDSAVRYFLAFHHVRIFNDSLQSVCDSMFLSTKDSVFRLYYDPVIWSGQTQITSDTIFLFTKNKQAERLYGFDKGLIVNKTTEGFFNQMAGKTINGYFKDGKIDYLRVKGSQAESIFYMQDDDSAYIGMNRATGDVIDLYFQKEKLKRVLFVNEIKGNMYPMNQIPPDQKELKDFKWLDSRRPKNKLELFE
jgi:lipopolysaccharide export system protein LptA